MTAQKRGSNANGRRHGLHPSVRSDVNLLIGAQAISTFGSFITRAALPLLAIIGLGINAAEAAALAAVDLIAGALVSQFAGVWIDRLPRKPVLIATDLLRALLLGSIPLAATLFGGVTLPHLIAVSSLCGMCATTFDIAERSYFAGLVDSSALRAVLARTLGIRGAAEFFGFGSAGLLVGAFGGPAAIGIDALTYIASAVLIGFLRVAEPKLPSVSARGSFLRELSDGLKATWSVVIMRPLLISTFVIGLYFGLFRSSYLLFVSNGLGLGPEAIGFVIATGGIAALLGGVFTERFSRFLGVGRAIAVSLMIVGFGLILVPLAPGATAVGIAMLIGHQLLSDGFETVWEANQAAIRGRVLPANFQGRANAANDGVAILGRLLGIIVGGLIGSSVAGSGAALLVGGCASIAIGIFVGASRLGSITSIAQIPASVVRRSAK
ncbi:MAG: MFS transporter [Candidatus Limnocylindrus sp.]